MMKNTLYDLVIIGAGPAGMSAATCAAEQGLKVALLDEQTNLGGQIYRKLYQPSLKDESILGADYYQGRELITQVQQSQLDYFPEASVWQVTCPEKNDSTSLEINLSIKQQGQQLKAKKLLIATGAQERPTPFPGWTLPGVMTCGAAQILLKTSAMTPASPLVIVGSGPLLLLIAAQLTRAGVSISGLLDTRPKGRYIEALPHLAGALNNLPLLAKGLALMAEVRKAGIPIYKNVTDLAALANPSDRLEKVSFKTCNKDEEIHCSTLLTHQGVVPNVQLSRALQLDHIWHKDQACWHPVKNEWGQSSHPDIFIAGDGSGITGAKGAANTGRIAALKIARSLAKISQGKLTKLAQSPSKKLAKETCIRPFIDRLYYPAQTFLTPEDDTLVCRCEEVLAKDIRHMVKQGCTGPNQTKAFSRVGMGPCQGRLCGLTVSNIIAEESQRPVDEVGYYQVRSPIKPITLGELIDLDK